MLMDSRSFASVNIEMVAVWLSSLTGEERERFQMLRRKFVELQVGAEPGHSVVALAIRLVFHENTKKQERRNLAPVPCSI